MGIFKTNNNDKDSTKGTLTISSPWAAYYHELVAFFKKDDDVAIFFDNNIPTIKLFIDNPDKAEALSKLLPQQVRFGNVTLNITIVPANAITTNVEMTNIEIIEKAFEGNDAVSFIKTITGVMTNPLTFVVFKKEVVQYFNDNLGDIFGVNSTLYQYIAEDLLTSMEGIYYCTDIK